MSGTLEQRLRSMRELDECCVSTEALVAVSSASGLGMGGAWPAWAGFVVRFPMVLAADTEAEDVGGGLEAGLGCSLVLAWGWVGEFFDEPLGVTLDVTLGSLG